MKNAFSRTWGIHTQNDFVFLNESVIAIGWEELGDLSSLDKTKDAIKNKYQAVFPTAKKMNVANCVGSISRFVIDMQIGDYIVFPSKYNREINLGMVDSDYYFDSNAKIYNHRRKVKWLKHLPRTAFSQGALYEVGAFTTCFEIKNYTDEFLQALDKDFKTQKTESSIDETIERTAADIQNNTCDFILKELSRKQKGYDLEDFVADLLRAMGYRATVSPKGGDGGVDITAYKDELPPRILVQVKSQDGDIKEATIQSLKGAMKEGDYGLFVTLSNYTPNALKYLESTPIIRGISGEELANLILKYYDKLPDRCKKIIPLSAVYIPDIKTE
ncbi:MAG: restriction endonuclease [Clostridia bacterium]|nr:restriction endonuclease [Clostridia bacterium]